VTSTCFYGAYERIGPDEWIYPWGEVVPGARDLSAADILGMGLPRTAECGDRASLLRAMTEDPLACHVSGPEGDTEMDALTRVVGMYAPELHACAMLTVADIAQLLEVAPDTIAAYRHRGYLPEPQAVIGRTPVWSRPIIRQWMESRPGNGWRTDLYGERSEYMEREAYIRDARRQRRRPVMHSVSA
jgi:hypothetical protein